MALENDGLKIETISVDEPDRWRKAIAALPIAPAHTWDYNYSIAPSSHGEIKLFFASRENQNAVCPILCRSFESHFDIASPYGFGGFIGDLQPVDLAKAWNKFNSDRGTVASYVALGPENSYEACFKPDEIFPAKPVFIVDLSLTEEKLSEALASNRRYDLKRWLSRGYKVIDDKKVLLTAAKELYPKTLDRVEASSTYRFSDETLERLFDIETTVALGIEEEGKVTALSVFLSTPCRGEYFLNASTIPGRAHSKGLIWLGMTRLKSIGVSKLNLGGGAREHDQLEDFKQRFGGQKASCKSLQQIHNSEVYEHLSSGVDRARVNNADFFPLYRATPLSGDQT